MGSGERILICDDDELMRSIIHISLAQVGGFVVTVTSSGADAVNAFTNDGADLVVLDVNMPEMDGPQTLAKIRGCPGGDSVPIVFLSATDDPAEIEHLRALGAAQVITKPFDIIKFPEAVRRILQISRAGATENK